MDLASAPKPASPMPFRRGERSAASGLRGISRIEATSPSFSDAWGKLARTATEPNPFYERWFVLPSLDAFDPGGAVQLFAHYTNGELTGIMPLLQRSRYYGYTLPNCTNWLHDNAFCGTPLIAKGHEEDFWTDVLSSLDRQTGPELLFHAHLLPEGGPVERGLIAACERAGRQSAIVDRRQRAMLSSSDQAEDYLAKALGGKHRKDLRRQRRRLAEHGELGVERLYDRSDIAGWIEDYLALEASGWKGDAGTALAHDPAHKMFFSKALTGAAEAGRLERLALTLDGRRIAMLATFKTAPGAFSFKTAFDERLARYSPGMLLQIENLASLEATDLDWTDSCAAPGHPMIERLWKERRTLVSYNIALGGRIRRTIARPLIAYEARSRGTA